jgi:hypothetical protein
MPNLRNENKNIDLKKLPNLSMRHLPNFHPFSKLKLAAHGGIHQLSSGIFKFSIALIATEMSITYFISCQA